MAVPSGWWPEGLDWSEAEPLKGSKRSEDIFGPGHGERDLGAQVRGMWGARTMLWKRSQRQPLCGSVGASALAEPTPPGRVSRAGPARALPVFCAMEPRPAFELALVLGQPPGPGAAGET